jgi:death-on-curing protein
VTGRSKKPATSPEPRWISKSAALVIHELLLDAHGGAPGIVDAHLIDSALASPRNHFAYGTSDVFELAGIYAYALIQDHPFVDGNKRVAFTIAVTFLERNGFRLAGPEPEAVQIILDLSSRKANAAAFAGWLRDHSQRVTPARPKTKKKAVRIRVVKRK